MIESQQQPDSIPIQPSQKTIRADIITNHQFSLLLLKLIIFFFLTCYIFQIIPNAIQITTYTPQKWQRIDQLQLHDVSPLNRFIKIYTSPVDYNEEMDAVMEVEVYNLIDNQQKERKLDVQVMDMDDFVDISENQLRFYFGDLHILSDVAYRIKVKKPIKVKRILQEQIQQKNQQNTKNNTLDSLQQNATKTNETKKQTQLQRRKKQLQQLRKQKQKQQAIKKQQQNKAKKLQQERIKKQQEQKKKKQQQKAKKQQQEKAKKQQEQQAKKQQQQKQRKQQQQKAKKQQQQLLKKQQQQRKIQQQKQRIYDHTNIRLQIHQMNTFATVVQLIVRYISMLVIIYVATDNPDAPRSIAIICVITSNPALFLQISYPNIISDVIDSLCRSGPMLYFPLWLYYIHTNTSMNIQKKQQSKYRIYLIIKITLGILLYLLNTLLLLHFHVFGLQTLIGVILSFLIGKHLWKIFINLQQQHHRDKVLMVVSFIYLGSLFTFKIITGSWKDLMFYIIHQMYGLYVIYLMAAPKIKGSKVKKEKKRAYTMAELQNVKNNGDGQFKQPN